MVKGNIYDTVVVKGHCMKEPFMSCFQQVLESFEDATKVTSNVLKGIAASLLALLVAGARFRLKPSSSTSSPNPRVPGFPSGQKAGTPRSGRVHEVGAVIHLTSPMFAELEGFSQPI